MQANVKKAEMLEIDDRDDGTSGTLNSMVSEDLTSNEGFDCFLRISLK